jgi:hypothetical protein
MKFCAFVVLVLVVNAHLHGLNNRPPLFRYTARERAIMKWLVFCLRMDIDDLVAVVPLARRLTCFWMSHALNVTTFVK